MPPLSHEPSPLRGILLVNLGSPESTDVADVRRYLDEFLMDRHVIDAPWLVRRLIVSATILPTRPKRTAHAYRAIWTDAGSPLIVRSQAFAAALSTRIDMPVALAMRYGEPRIDAAIDRLCAERVDEILLVPLYPQHADSTRTTAIEAVHAALAQRGARTRLRVLPPFATDPRYLDALAGAVRRHLPHDAHLLFSFHGLPERALVRSDPTGTHCLARGDCCEVPSAAHATCYRHQALATARGVAARIALEPTRWQLSFQSRLGRLRWLEPYTDVVLDMLPAAGVRNLAVVCPAFVADNLETLEEIDIRGRARFLGAGGETFVLIPCLNDDPAWVDAVADWCRDPPPEAPFDAAPARSDQRAIDAAR